MSVMQAPKAIVMVRPHHFTINPETAADNHFQSLKPLQSTEQNQAYDEVTVAATTLSRHGIKVHLFEDQTDLTPDSVFPNNWFSTHANGQVGVYPMKPENRRLERRQDIIELLKSEYRVSEVIDYSGLEKDHVFLEGTGALVLDHLHGIAYAGLSERAHANAIYKFCQHFGYRAVTFHAHDEKGKAVYHTNVMMGIATEYAMVGLDLIQDPTERQLLQQTLEATGRTVIPLSNHQIKHFAGNVIELQASQGRILALSKTAYDCLTTSQKMAIEKSTQLVPLSIPTIELAGGSVRCTIAGVHLQPRSGL